jgi:hypothetical protein
MTQDRYNDLKVALYEHIKERGPCDDLTLLTWLVSRLDEWVERLDGAFSCGRIMQTDFFGGLTVSIEVIGEVKSTSEFKPLFPEREWMEFRNAVTWLEKTRDREEMSLVEKTYQKFKNRFAAISGENSNPEKEPGTRIDSKPSRTDGKQSANQGGPPKIELDGPTQVEWWPRSNLLSPVELRISRALLSLGILLILGSMFCFVNSLIESGARPGAAFLLKETSVCFFYLSVLFFAVWAALWLWFQVRRKSQK